MTQERQSLQSAKVLKEAEPIKDEVTEELRRLSYRDLQRFFETESRHMVGPSGIPYYVEILSFWDEEKEGNLRVTISVYAGISRAPKIPMSSFIVAPDGHFVGE